jgi:diaminohydroxyphosphoribosylaminopyrimidine deaminase / 5-amino-6-(5-phosphoribosylamino)uracil reductase
LFFMDGLSVDDELMMRRALTLAVRGNIGVKTNPLVGCVVVDFTGNVVGEGWHSLFGGPHAEVVAIASMNDPITLAGCTVYVTLEPCAHYGKTPPCAALLAQLGPKRVVVAVEDPNPLVAGKGLNMLREAGIEVSVGICSAEAEYINRRFFVRQKVLRPYVVLKWAKSLDGYMAPVEGKGLERKSLESKEIGENRGPGYLPSLGYWLTGEPSRIHSHKRRGEEDAILVGYRTALLDDPALTARAWPSGKGGLKCARIALDWEGSLPPTLRLFADDGAAVIHCYQIGIGSSTAAMGHITQLEIDRNSREEGGWVFTLLKALYTMGIGSVLVEGGAATLSAFIQQEVWDEATVYTAPKTLIYGLLAPQLPLKAEHSIRLGEDCVESFFRVKP